MKRRDTLADLEVLVLDIQASGANPASGDILEIGWTFTRGSVEWKENRTVPPVTVEFFLLKIPEENDIPRRVTRITGITKEDTLGGCEPAEAWNTLMEKIKGYNIVQAGGLMPTAIHFAGYEESFLRYLHETYSPEEPFYFDIICTHRMVKKMFPALPRKGLRAAAGFLGYSVPEFRRSEDHVAATAFIWHRLVEKLEEANIFTLEQLKEYITAPLPKPADTGRQYPMEKNKRSGLPKEPGVYRMLRSNGDLLYIGKATSLRHRVNSYFHTRKKNGHAEHTLEMLTQAVDLKVTVTGSALEAALLETDEIKLYSPPYNIALRERERKTGFFSRDFNECSAKPDESHPVGPLPVRDAMAAYGGIKHCIEQDWEVPDVPDIAGKILGVLPEFAPDRECFLQGITLFRERFGDFFNKYGGNSIYNGLMIFGKESRRRKLEEAARAKAAIRETEDFDEEAVEEKSAEEWVWTPEAVAGAVEGIIRFGSLLIRRSRWFCILSESVLAWTTGKTSGQGTRLLVFRSGEIMERKNLENNLKNTVHIPLPPGYDKTFKQRQETFDLITYDRMRVLTTEIRRLVSDETDRNVRLRLGTGTVLDREKLIQLLQWV